ncbi:MAG: glutathione S-transferase N-terminal domain-containing protein [Patescibacteria group bacterium]|nr:glutathione S-transferase N-terminal domain-containing protein [Patescibacteria group bacterium]
MKHYPFFRFVLTMIIMYGTPACPDCVRVKSFLESKLVPYKFVDTAAEEGAQEAMLGLNGGIQKIPTLVFPDGSVLIEPANDELDAKIKELNLDMQF